MENPSPSAVKQHLQLLPQDLVSMIHTSVTGDLTPDAILISGLTYFTDFSKYHLSNIHLVLPIIFRGLVSATDLVSLVDTQPITKYSFGHTIPNFNLPIHHKLVISFHPYDLNMPSPRYYLSTIQHAAVSFLSNKIFAHEMHLTFLTLSVMQVSFLYIPSPPQLEMVSVVP